MKRMLLFAVAAAALAAAGSAECSAAEGNQAQVPKSVLTDLGLGGLQPLSDTQALDVRGKSFFGTPGKGSFLTLRNEHAGWDGVIVGHHYFGGTLIVNHPTEGFMITP